MILVGDLLTHNQPFLALLFGIFCHFSVMPSLSSTPDTVLLYQVSLRVTQTGPWTELVTGPWTGLGGTSQTRPRTELVTGPWTGLGVPAPGQDHGQD